MFCIPPLENSTSVEETWEAAVEAAWEAIPVSTLQNCMLSIPCRLAKCIKLKGRYTGYSMQQQLLQLASLLCVWQQQQQHLKFGAALGHSKLQKFGNIDKIRRISVSASIIMAFYISDEPTSGHPAVWLFCC